MLCANRPENFGPLSRLYGHTLTSCFLDIILVPLCTWMYLAALAAVAVSGTILHPRQPSTATDRGRFGHGKITHGAEANQPATEDRSPPRTRIHTALAISYYLLLLAQFLMCILEIVRLSLTHLGVGLLPFTLVGLITAGAVRFTKGLYGRMYGWKYLNLALWVALAITNGVKIAQETKEGTDSRKTSKYPVADEITDVAVMVGVYAVLALLEMILKT